MDVVGNWVDWAPQLLDFDALNVDIPLIDQSLIDLVPGLSTVFSVVSCGVSIIFSSVGTQVNLDVSLPAIQAQIATWLNVPTFNPQLPADWQSYSSSWV